MIKFEARQRIKATRQWRFFPSWSQIIPTINMHIKLLISLFALSSVPVYAQPFSDPGHRIMKRGVKQEVKQERFVPFQRHTIPHQPLLVGSPPPNLQAVPMYQQEPQRLKCVTLHPLPVVPDLSSRLGMKTTVLAS